MKNFIVLFCLSILIIGCNSSEKVTTEITVESSAPSATVPPGIPTTKLIEVYENCDHIDFIFSSLPFSLSQEDKSSIQQTMKYINNKPPESINENCPWFAQLLFQEDGEFVLDAKVFFQDDCLYYLFYDEMGQPEYSGSFTQEGIKFYNNLIAQVQQNNSNG